MTALRPADLKRRMMLVVVMAAIVLAQMLGLLHGVVHVSHAAPVEFGSFASTPTGEVLAALSSQRRADPHDHAEAAGAHPHADEPHHAGSHAGAHRHAEDGPASVLDRLFGGHEDHGCDAYDELSHADFLWGGSTALIVAPADCGPPSFHPAWHLAAQAAGYLARGPPNLT